MNAREQMAKALEMRRANGGEIASFGTTPEKLRAMATVITVERVKIPQNRIHGPGAGAAWRYGYEAYGPEDDPLVAGDGLAADDTRVLPRKFDNSSIVTLREVLRKRYGRNTIIVEAWKVAK
jgi:hypothetical protein